MLLFNSSDAIPNKSGLSVVRNIYIYIMSRRLFFARNKNKKKTHKIVRILLKIAIGTDYYGNSTCESFIFARRRRRSGCADLRRREIDRPIAAGGFRLLGRRFNNRLC